MCSSDLAERVLGEGGLTRLLDDVRAHADRMVPHGRTLIDAWLDHVAEHARI